MSAPRPFTAPDPEPNHGDLAAVWGERPTRHGGAPRLLGVFAHPDDEVFCVGGTMARCARSGARTAVVSLARGEAGEIRDASSATRRTLGSVREAELADAADALGVEEATCMDLGDGRLEDEPIEALAQAVSTAIHRFQPDVVVTFGPDGAFGHPDHVASCLATLAAVGAEGEPPRLLHARFPTEERLLVGLLVDWLTSEDQRFRGTAAFAHALKLFADGSSMLGFAADHLDVEWFPAGSYIIEQGEAADRLYCILSGSVEVVTEDERAGLNPRATLGAGCFVGEDGLATGGRRNSHVIAREDVTCLVLAPEPPSSSAGRGPGAAQGRREAHRRGRPAADGVSSVQFSVDVRRVLDRKVAALSAHRSQYALDANMLPRSLLEGLLGTEHFTVACEGGSGR